jgi:hypothetical protein
MAPLFFIAKFPLEHHLMLASKKQLFDAKKTKILKFEKMAEKSKMAAKS